MLEAKNVVKTFDGFRALDGVSMTVPQGAVYGLVGPNGAGKSTIIRHFTGIYRPDSGEITLDGQPIYENPAVKGRMAAIPDDWYFFPQASIREMARLYAGMLVGVAAGDKGAAIKTAGIACVIAASFARISSVGSSRSGTITGTNPPAQAASIPLKLSSRTTHSSGAAPAIAAALWKISGSGLLFVTMSPQT